MGWAVVYGVQFALFVCGVPLCYYVHTLQQQCLLGCILQAN